MIPWMVTLDCNCDEGEHRVRGWYLPNAPGLVVHQVGPHPPCANITNDWLITHQRSGLVVCGAKNPELAVAFAHRLAALFDWTRPAREVRDERAEPVHRLLAEYAPHVYRANGAAASEAALAR